MDRRYTSVMYRSLARREALRVFRILLIIQLAGLALSSLALAQWGVSLRIGLVLRAIPTVLLVLLFVPPWLERALGRSFLALGLGLEVFFSSLDMIYLFTERPAERLAAMGLPAPLVEHAAASPPVEPFFFLLIPLVLAAWGYGRRGALAGSTLAAALHLAIGLWATTGQGGRFLFLAQATARITLLYLVPFIVSVLAERERAQHASLEAAHQRLQRHAATVEQLAVSRERNRLARELHDTLAHSLSALTVQLEALRALLKNDAEAAEPVVGELAALARHGLEESRQAIQALRREPVEVLGLENALRDMLQAFQARTGVSAHLTVSGNGLDLTTAEAQTLYRIAEESLINVERHAAAQRVEVRLACGSDRVDLVIHDDGVGFDPMAVNPDHYGLTGMAERANMVGATLEVRSHPGGGTEVWCTLEK
jgi:signal transduction histidine kinase